MPFQTKVNLGNPSGWHGGIASTNTKISVFTGGAFNEEAFGAGSGGVNAGTFVWFNETDNTLDNTGTGKPAGFVANEMQGLITHYLQENSMLIPQGFMVTACSKGEFFVQIPQDASTVKRLDSVYVDPKTGAITDITTTGAIETDFKYAKNADAGDLVVISSWL